MEFKHASKQILDSNELYRFKYTCIEIDKIVKIKIISFVLSDTSWELSR